MHDFKDCSTLYGLNQILQIERRVLNDFIQSSTFHYGMPKVLDVK